MNDVNLPFGPPKPVSIAALAVGDDRLTAAYDRAVGQALIAVEAVLI